MNNDIANIIARICKTHGSVEFSTGVNRTLCIEVPNVLAVSVQPDSDELAQEVLAVLESVPKV